MSGSRGQKTEIESGPSEWDLLEQPEGLAGRKGRYFSVDVFLSFALFGLNGMALCHYFLRRRKYIFLMTHWLLLMQM